MAFCPTKTGETCDNKIDLCDIIKFDPDILPVTYEESNPIYTEKGENYVSIISGRSEIKKGDYLVVRNKNYKVVDVTDDDPRFIKEGARNNVYIEGFFPCKVQRYRFHYKKMPQIHGYLHEFKKTSLKSHNPVIVEFSKKRKDNNHGDISVKFHSLAFNSLGFFTQDRAIPNPI